MGDTLMDFYHGSVQKGLSVLKPFASEHNNLQEPCVYLTTNKQLALHYIWDVNRLPIKMPMLDIRKDGVLVFQEMFSGALKYFYNGLSGYVYHCTGTYELNSSIGVSSCAISKDDVEIKDSEFIADVYERIIEYGKYGTFIYEKFEDLPRYRHDIIRGHIMRLIKENNCLDNQNSPFSKLCIEKYPKYWKEAEVLEKNNLL
jgi:hypothetical protein